MENSIILAPHVGKPIAPRPGASLDELQKLIADNGSIPEEQLGALTSIATLFKEVHLAMSASLCSLVSSAKPSLRREAYHAICLGARHGFMLVSGSDERKAVLDKAAEETVFTLIPVAMLVRYILGESESTAEMRLFSERYIAHHKREFRVAAMAAIRMYEDILQGKTPNPPML